MSSPLGTYSQTKAAGDALVATVPKAVGDQTDRLISATEAPARNTHPLAA